MPKARRDAQPLREFAERFAPREKFECLLTLVDKCTNATYCECHIKASVLVPLVTIDVPLDPEGQPKYRANRGITNHAAFESMKSDAAKGRSFSNIVAEYTTKFDAAFPLKIIGGQHRFKAIQYALNRGVNEYHGFKVYFNLSTSQRKDVQTISNTNIEVSRDFIDRLNETGRGAELRDWCQAVGFLKPNQDFADVAKRGGPIPVRMARTFITNYFLGKAIKVGEFESVPTTPMMYKGAGPENEWEELTRAHDDLWTDESLLEAGREFAALITAQRAAFSGKSRAKNGKTGSAKAKPDYPEKAVNMAIVAAWAFVAGVLQSNPERLRKHFELKSWTAHDPLNAEALSTAKHEPTDPPNYRGLGSRTDPQERGRFAELFFMQAEEGKGINKRWVDSAIKQYHAKQSQLDAESARARARAS